MSAPLYSGYPLTSAVSSGSPLSPEFQGPVGPAGPAGTDGTDGVSAYTTLTGDFVQPAVGVAVLISVANSDWIGTGQVLYIVTGGYYSVSNVPSTTSVSVVNLGYVGNAAELVTIHTGSHVSPAGSTGPAGAQEVYRGTTAERDATTPVGSALWILTDSDPANQLSIWNGVAWE